MVTVIKRLHSVIAKPENYTSGMPEWMTALSKAFNAAGKCLSMSMYNRLFIGCVRYTFECKSISCQIDLQLQVCICTLCCLLDTSYHEASDQREHIWCAYQLSRARSRGFGDCLGRTSDIQGYL